MKKNVLIVAGALFVAGCAKQADPVITLNGEEQMTIYAGDTWTDPGATATDYKGRDISADIEILGTVPATSGSTTLDYTVSDKKGNFSVEQRVVTRGFKNSDLAGTYSVERSTNNGGGTQTYTGTITASTSDIVTITIDNSNSYIGSVIMTATLTSSGTQITIEDQTSGSCEVMYGQYGYASNSTGEVVLELDFATNCSWTGVYNHETTWTKQ